VCEAATSPRADPVKKKLARFFSYRRVQDELQAILAKPNLAPPCSPGVETQ